MRRLPLCLQVLLNDTNLFELLLSEEMMMDVVGALEYDPELLTKQNHRSFLKESVVFKEVCATPQPTSPRVNPLEAIRR